MLPPDYLKRKDGSIEYKSIGEIALILDALISGWLIHENRIKEGARKSVPICNTLNQGFTFLYFLLHKTEIVYIGQTINLIFRLGEHQKNKKFDSVYFLQFPSENIMDIEFLNIAYHSPKYNGNHTTSGIKANGLRQVLSMNACEMFKYKFDHYFNISALLS